MPFAQLASRSRFLLLTILLIAPAARAATSGANATHDPTRIVESAGKFYFCSTGGGCASSSNGLAWASAGALRIAVPSWSSKYMSGDQGVWAPDILFFGDRYLIYYSFCGVPAADAPCAIGLLTTPTLDPASSSFKLTDAGMVLNNPKNDATYQFSAIDPAPIVDADGNLWVVWGSGYGKDQSKTQIWITRMDNATGLPLATDKAYKPPTVLGYPLKTGRREGAYMHHRDGTYYLFWNEGSCCSGTSSTYTIWVSRSTSITGPFTGDKVFYASTGDIHGPGHMGIYSACGVERFTYHYYPTATSILGENELSWGSDGWPVVGPESTKLLVPCDGTGGAGGSAGRDAGLIADAAAKADASRAGDANSGAGGIGVGPDGGAGSTGSGGAGRTGGNLSSGGGSVTGGMVSSTGGARLGRTTSMGGEGAAAVSSGGAVKAGASAGSTHAATSGGMRGGNGPTASGTKGGATAGSGTTPDRDSAGSSGCSCRLGSGRQPHGGMAGLFLVAMIIGAARRNRQRTHTRRLPLPLFVADQLRPGPGLLRGKARKSVL